MQNGPKQDLSKEQALRGAYFTAALACIALDSALERVVYDDPQSPHRTIQDGVTYGDAGDARVQNSLKAVLDIIARSLENGRVISKQAEAAMDKRFQDLRADIIAEYFTKEHNARVLVDVAKELDACAHHVDPKKIQRLSREAKSVLGVYADFVRANRGALLNGNLSERAGRNLSKRDDEGSRT